MEKEQIEHISQKLIDLDAVISTTGHPAFHPLQGLHLLKYDTESLEQLKDLLKNLQGQLYQYTALKLFVADKPDLQLPEVSWLPEWKPAAELANETVYQQILKPIVFRWKTVENKSFLFKHFAKKKYLKTWEEGCAAHVQNLESTYTAIQELAVMEFPTSDAVTVLPRDLTRWCVYLGTRSKDWAQWCMLKQELEDLQLHELVDCFIKQQKSGSEIAQMLRK